MPYNEERSNLRQFHNRKKGGFTLIELMIVVAIIGILAAIAIPNFLRFQLKAKSSEGKTNISAIRTAQEGYFAEFGDYVPAAMSPDNFATPSVKEPFVNAAGANAGFEQLGWSPEGNVFFRYETNRTAGSASYIVGAHANIDAKGSNQSWGYVKTANTAALTGVTGCVAAGVYDPVAGTQTLHDTVGPCDSTSGQSVF